MLNRYRVFGAILALREFTVTDLARYSEVKETTVRTILARESRYVERIGTQARGRPRPGGQAVTYRMRSDVEQKLVRMLREVESVGSTSTRPDEIDAATLTLIAAEDILLRKLPLAATNERANLLSLAVADYETALIAANPDEREVATHLGIVDLLVRLAEVEQEALLLTPPSSVGASASPNPKISALAPSHEAEKKLVAIGRDLNKILSGLPELSDKTLLPDLLSRLIDSPFAQVLLHVSDESESPQGFSPQVLLFNTRNAESSDVEDFVEQTLRQQEVPFLPVSRSCWEGLANLHISREAIGAAGTDPIRTGSPLTVFCVTVQADTGLWRTALRPFGTTYGALRRTVVITDRYDEHISNHVNELQGRYLCAQGLQPAALIGALSGALSEPSGLLLPVIADDAATATGR